MLPSLFLVLSNGMTYVVYEGRQFSQSLGQFPSFAGMTLGVCTGKPNSGPLMTRSRGRAKTFVPPYATTDIYLKEYQHPSTTHVPYVKGSEAWVYLSDPALSNISHQ